MNASPTPTATAKPPAPRALACAARLAAGTLLLVSGLSACKVGPDYKRPPTATPDAFRAAATDITQQGTPGTNSFANLAWSEAIGDPQLQNYLTEALTNNWDARIAATRVLQAEAVARVARSEFFPTLAAGGDLLTTRGSERGPNPIPPGVETQREFGDVFAALSSYELDLWGRIRHANDAARARLLASREARHAVLQTLVAQVAIAYLELLELDLELIIARNTLAARNDSFTLTEARESGGVASLQDVHQARILVATAEASIADISGRIERKENEFNLLLGRNPGPVVRGVGLESKTPRREVPAGLTSDLLQRRPDIRVSEQALIAAHGEVGQARAAFYPQVTLTGRFGFQSVALSDLFTAPARTWQFGPAVTLPLFTGGRLRGNLKYQQARFDEALFGYQRTVQSAFHEVSDALISVQRTQEFRARQEERARAHREARDLALVRYQGGVTSYLEVLYNEQELFGADLSLAVARRNELLAVVQLYRALGGGWSPTP
jgi:multidrug efflux system outer membrane protein